MVVGQMVTVKLYGGEKVQRRVVAIKGKIIVICAEEEYQAARREGREPEGLGFPESDILETVEV
jgi:hypothetical protein